MSDWVDARPARSCLARLVTLVVMAADGPLSLQSGVRATSAQLAREWSCGAMLSYILRSCRARSPPGATWQFT